METDNSHYVTMGKSCKRSSAFIFDWIFFILAVEISDEFEIWTDTTTAAIERLNKSP